MDDLQLDGAPNFRDLGGYRRADGRSLRRNRVFRSDHLADLTPSDIERLHRRVGPHWRVLDFRGMQERLSAPCALPMAQVHSLAIEPTVVQKLSDLLGAGRQVSAQHTAELMQETYRHFVEHNTPRFAEFFQHLLHDPGTPVVFHCTAGKDRTGFAAALLLHALDIPESVIWQDYLLTNERLRVRTRLASRLPEPIAHVLHRVQPDFLQAALDVVVRDHGGVSAYLHQALGVGPEQREELAARLLD